jgi:hypothetical protein
MPMTAIGVTDVVPVVGEEFAEAERLTPSSIAPNKAIPPPHSNDYIAFSAG